MARMTDDLTDLAKTSFALVALYLVLKNAGGGSQILSAGGKTYIGIVKALQGR